MQLSLASVVLESARYHPDTLAVVDGADRLTYGELGRRCRAAAGALSARGVGPGDHVALMAPNTCDFVVTYYAILIVGGVVVPVPPMLVPEEIAYLLSDSGATLIASHPAFFDNASKAAGMVDVPVLATSPTGVEGADDLVTLAASATPTTVIAGRAVDDTAVLFYTSGTTGRPKGAVLSHGNLVMNAMTSAFFANGFSRDDVVLGCLPLFHTFGQSAVMNGMFLVGGRLILQPQFAPDAALDLMLAEGVNVFIGVPTMFIALLDAARGRTELPSLRMAMSGGAALPVAIWERFRDTFGVEIGEGYGLSETSPVASVNQKTFGIRPGTVGHPIWGVDVDVAAAEIDDRIDLLPAGELGEIVIRGHNVFERYHNNPEATAAALVDGWFRTGDLGTKDPASGAISIVDRKKDLIIRGGYNVYPREVEEVLLRHPGIGQVAVVGIADDLRGEEVLAVVVPADPDNPPVAQEIIAWSQEHLAKHKYPRRVEFVAELPLGPSRKVLKRELRREFSPPPAAS